jgi:hypothetical protein
MRSMKHDWPTKRELFLALLVGGVVLITMIVLMQKAVGATNHSTLRQGDTGYEVTQVQFILKSNSYAVPISGTFEARTDKAVRHFQKASGLEPDGVVGSATWKVLDNLYYRANPASPSWTPAAPPGNPGVVVPGDGPEAASAALVAAGGDASEVNFGVLVCERESHCRLGAVNQNSATRDNSWGPWQINYFGNLMNARSSSIGAPATNTSSWVRAAQNFLKFMRAAGRCPWQAPRYCS